MLYSTNTKIAYWLNRTFYRDVHFVWCSPEFGSTAFTGTVGTNAASSSPLRLYRSLAEESSSNDRHGPYIQLNKTGLRKGADAKLAQSVITKAQFDDIMKVIDRATPAEFRPVMYVIPWATAASIAEDVPADQRASLMSVEYMIPALPRSAFDVISWNDE